MRTADKQLVPAILGLCLGGLLLAGCTTEPPVPEPDPEPVPTIQGMGLPDAEPLPAPSLSPAEALVRRTAEELDPDLLPDGFFYVDVVDLDGAGRTSAVYASADAPGHGPTLFVHSGPNGPTALIDGWREVPELSGTYPVSVGPSLAGPTGTTVTIDASPAGVVRLIGDGVPEQDLLAMAARLLGAS